MDANGGNYNCCAAESHEKEDLYLKRGPWTLEEDLVLINYVISHGEGHWNYVASSSGLRRTGKSCRLRWLNYLSPDVRRGNITLEEQLTILKLHSCWGNRWSKIAQHLPGRTDNEIKNYWRTRVQKHAKQMGCNVNSKLFKDTVRYIWIPRLEEKIQATPKTTSSTITTTVTNHMLHVNKNMNVASSFTSEDYSMNEASKTDFPTDYSDVFQAQGGNTKSTQIGFEESLTCPLSYFNYGFEFQDVEQNSPWAGYDDLWGNFV